MSQRMMNGTENRPAAATMTEGTGRSKPAMLSLVRAPAKEPAPKNIHPKISANGNQVRQPKPWRTRSGDCRNQPRCTVSEYISCLAMASVPEKWFLSSDIITGVP